MQHGYKYFEHIFLFKEVRNKKSRGSHILQQKNLALSRRSDMGQKVKITRPTESELLNHPYMDKFPVPMYSAYRVPLD